MPVAVFTGCVGAACLRFCDLVVVVWGLWCLVVGLNVALLRLMLGLCLLFAG